MRSRGATSSLVRRVSHAHDAGAAAHLTRMDSDSGDSVASSAWMRKLPPPKRKQAKALKKLAETICMGLGCEREHRGEEIATCCWHSRVCSDSRVCASSEPEQPHYMCRLCRSIECSRCSALICNSCDVANQSCLQVWSPPVCDGCKRREREEREAAREAENMRRWEKERAAEEARIEARVKERLAEEARIEAREKKRRRARTTSKRPASPTDEPPAKRPRAK